MSEFKIRGSYPDSAQAAAAVIGCQPGRRAMLTAFRHPLPLNESPIAVMALCDAPLMSLIGITPVTLNCEIGVKFSRKERMVQSSWLPGVISVSCGRVPVQPRTDSVGRYLLANRSQSASCVS
jgi:hypothetical protein